MNLSFYVASTGAQTHQKHLDVIGNNIANASTIGYKTSVASFTETLYSNVGRLNNQDLTYGSGAKLEKTDTLFTQAGFNPTGGLYDFAIEGEGFFATRNLQTGQVTYTRDGTFRESQIGDNFYLTTQDGRLVLDKNANPIQTQEGKDYKNLIGVYTFATNEGLLRQGNNSFLPTDRNGNATLAADYKIYDGMLELSNVDLGVSMTKIIEAQRAYQFNIRVIQTTDENIQTINSLRR